MELLEENLIFTYKARGTKCPNKYYKIFDDDKTIAIKITSKNKETVIALIDSEDFDKVKICNWKITKDCRTYYLDNSIHGRMHRLIMNPNDKEQIDHIDGNGLNNKKSNLRVVTSFENSRNKHYALGILFDDSGYPRFRVIWTDNDGKRRSKNFSKGKYKTLDEAYKEAKAFRRLIEINLYKNHLFYEVSNKLDLEYT